MEAYGMPKFTTSTSKRTKRKRDEVSNSGNAGERSLKRTSNVQSIHDKPRINVGWALMEDLSGGADKAKRYAMFKRYDKTVSLNVSEQAASINMPGVSASRVPAPGTTVRTSFGVSTIERWDFYLSFPHKPDPPPIQFYNHMKRVLKENRYPVDIFQGKIEEEWRNLSKEVRDKLDARFLEDMDTHEFYMRAYATPRNGFRRRAPPAQFEVIQESKRGQKV